MPQEKTTKEKLIEEFENKLKDLQKLSEELIDGKPSRIVYFGSKELVNDEIYTLPDWYNIKQFLSKAIDKTRDQTREETIKEVEEMLPLEYHPDGDSEKGYNACLGEIKITLNKLKK